MKKLIGLLTIIALMYSCVQQKPDLSLKDVYKEHFLMGTAVNAYHIRGTDTMGVNLIKKHFNTITNENALKWERIHPSLDTYNFELADQYVDFGEANDMFTLGHTLVWHSQAPHNIFLDANGNLASRDTMIQRMKDHIFTVVGRYKGRIDAWDVVNEAVLDAGGMRESNWYKTIGPDYVKLAFEFAHEADPEAELYYNDYSLWIPEKREATVQLVKSLQEEGVRVDGIGLQAHYSLNYPDMKEVEASIEAFAELGVKVMFTELDVAVLPRPHEYFGADISENYELQEKLNPYTEAFPDSMQVKLANKYGEIFETFIKHRDKIHRVTLWGIDDGHSWLNNWPIRGRTSYPLLFDRNYEPKKAFNAVIEAALITPTD